MTLAHPGFGLGYRSAFPLESVLDARPRVDFWEVVTENYLDASRQAMRRLRALREAFPVALHGVGLSIAGPDEVSREYLGKLRALKDAIGPCLVTDHLCWTSFRQHQSHDLLPVGLTAATLRRVQERVAMVQDHLGTAILLENPSVYVRAAHDEMGEAEFLAALTQATGCGVLLDVNNLVVNFHNAGEDPVAYMETLPRDAVRQFHIAGHSVKPNLRIDTHNRPMCEEGWHLFRLARARFPAAATLLEWDSDWPAFDELLAEVEKARGVGTGASDCAASMAFWAERSDAARRRVAESRRGPGDDAGFFPTLWQAVTGDAEALGEAAVSGCFDAAMPVPVAAGLAVYNDAYVIRAHDCLKDTYKAIHHVVGEDCFASLARCYVQRHPHASLSMNMVGDAFEAYVRENPDDFDFGAPAALMGDLAHFAWHQHSLFVAPDEPVPALAPESFHGIPADAWAQVTVGFVRNAHVAAAAFDVLPVWAAVKEGRDPAYPEETPSFYRLWAGPDSVFHKAITRQEHEAWRAMAAGATFADAAATVAESCGLDDEGAVITVVSALGAWFADGLIARLAW